MKYILRFASIYLFALLSTSSAQGAELRGLYVDAFHPGFKTHEQVTQMVSAAKAANFNALFVQVRKRGDAYYNSSIEPRASDIAVDYDPLADILAQAHAAGLEVHAWLSVLNVMHSSYTAGPNHVCTLHPDWLTKTPEDKAVFPSGSSYLDPSLPEVRQYIVSLVLDVAKKYALDGIYLDSIRIGTDGGYNDAAIALFNEETDASGIPDPTDDAWCQWRRQQVTALIRSVHDALSAAKPQIKLSATCMPVSPPVASKEFLEEWDVWEKEGLADFLVATNYWPAPDANASSLSKYTANRHLYLGLGAFKFSAELIQKQIEGCRSAGVQGVVLFSYHYLSPTTQADCTKFQDLASSVFSQPEPVPTMPWRSSGRPP